jgi:hypothetical protein
MILRPVRSYILLQKEPPVVRAALCFYSVIYFALTVAILTTNKSLIIRTTIRTTISERENNVFIGWLFRPIIGSFENKSRVIQQNMERLSNKSHRDDFNHIHTTM